MTVYGLPNCDTTRAAFKWLKQHKTGYTFRDLKAGITKQEITQILTDLPLEKLLNKKSTTWRALSPEQQELAATKDGAIGLLQEHTSLIKRPLVKWDDGTVTTGFSEEIFASHVKNK